MTTNQSHFRHEAAVAERPGRVVNESPAAEPPRSRTWGDAVKDAVFFVLLYCGYVPLRDAWLSLIGRSRAVVVYYHRIGDCDPLSKPAADFRRDLEHLKRRYECISLAELCRRLKGGKAMRRRSVAVTFDDGYRDNLTQALDPLLAAGVPATFFVATGFIDTRRQFPHDQRDGARVPRPNLTWRDLALMQAAGFEIGSHTVDHVNLAAADGPTVRRQIKDSLAALDRELGRRPRAFSFPWGKPADVPSDAMTAARDAGYYAVASAFGGANRRTADPFHIRRVDVGNGHLSSLAIRARIAGFDPDYLRLRVRGMLSRRPIAAVSEP
ncbi:MAG TPA: polysaccharide deacetylase family protein [Tepidisphaeraceae bacterium]|nr:polysaccharide deacetylase family protein [Tepidisphaeraceae bacterium]